MRKLFQHIRIEALLFLVFAALIWFVMTVSATTLERQYTINFTADASVVDAFWMQDSTIATLVTVQSKGLSALFMRQFNGVDISFSANNALRANSKGLFMLPTDLSRILTERFGGDYNFSFSSQADTFYFSTSALVTRSVPLSFETENIQLPEGYRWITPPSIVPAEIQITGPEWAIPDDPLVIDLPESEWKGRIRETSSLRELGRQLTQSVNKVVITAQSDLWVEDRFATQVTWEGHTHEVQIWLSGPFTFLKPTKWEANLNVALHAVEEGVGLDVDSENPHVTVLSYSPKILVHSQ